MKRVDWNVLDAESRKRILQRPAQVMSADVDASVGEILAAVAADGDIAARRFAQRFDGHAPEVLEVPRAQLDAAAALLPPTLLDAIEEAAGRIELFHRAGMAVPLAVETAPGLRCERVQSAIGCVGLYVPAGSAPLPSTALMLTIPTMLAGCAQVVLCSPPARNGDIDPAVLAVAARLPNVRVFRLGGAQAIAAMAFGTESVPRCDKLFGPGNAWVDAAKRRVAQTSGGPSIDLPAGPSELLIIADAGADPVFVAADLLSQAEHGPDSQVFLVSDNAALLDAVAVEVEHQLAGLPRSAIARRALASSRLVLVADLAQAIAISNQYAPEHLILALRNPRAWLPGVRAAGSVFLGDWTPEALGDYCSGSNHVLPTGGAARACSGLSVADFQTAFTVQEATREGLAATGNCASVLARAEGLHGHARAVELRLERAA